MKDTKVESKAQYVKFEAENRAIELEVIKKSKKKLKFEGHYVHITKYVKDFIPAETLIFIPEGVDEQKRILHFAERRKSFIHYF